MLNFNTVYVYLISVPRYDYPVQDKPTPRKLSFAEVRMEDRSIQKRVLSFIEILC